MTTMPNQDDHTTELTPEATNPESETTATMAGPEPPAEEQTEGGSQEQTGTPESSEKEEDETISALIAELAEAKKLADSAQDQALRAQAEIQNFRRRKERDASERIAQANARLLREVLPVIDDFERAFANVPADISAEDNAWVEGFRLILRKLQMVLEREGVTAIDATAEFDPNWHEAISIEPHDEVSSGHVIAEVQKGYKLNDKILRPSIVRVAE
jgi:molecular chaperone GrpE